jgi:hypothetical protein
MISGLLMVTVCCVCFTVGHFYGWKQGRYPSLYQVEEPEPATPVIDPEPTFEGLDPAVLKCFKRLGVARYRRGFMAITFELNLDELQPAERTVISHTAQIFADGSASLELLYNADYGDDVPF